MQLFTIACADYESVFRRDDGKAPVRWLERLLR